MGKEANFWETKQELWKTFGGEHPLASQASRGSSSKPAVSLPTEQYEQTAHRDDRGSEQGAQGRRGNLGDQWGLITVERAKSAHKEEPRTRTASEEYRICPTARYLALQGPMQPVLALPVVQS